MNMNTADLTPKARRTRLALLDAARAEIGRQGVAGMTVMAVCEKAGVGRTSFYNYFEDIDALVTIVARETATGIKTRFDRLHEEMPRGRDRLKACLSMILKAAADEPEAILLVISLSSSLPEIIDLLHKEISAELAAFAIGTEEDQLALEKYLAQTLLSLARQVVMGNIPMQEIDRHVEFMMRACG
ncbi:TetR/AcrR family transcriptional regulator [Aliiroseovarius sp. F20344]|uniref:TetR/AcrR family transcriptional regulator n=1 Tax=Aliiroseovarius sp. F20344 TaxID=2926414 RepID=UPI001FF3F3E0|nr:TetR/AcrR family transcriptional regulator [Aliiroseovarius sp. F20344]MCK0141267.1 TetR/AcrR family transcriptional regulator [Aliiroseovarius sp. F20344]